MSASIPATGLLQAAAILAATLALSLPLGRWIAQVLEGRFADSRALPFRLERAILGLCSVRGAGEMGWAVYARALLIFNAAGFVLTYLILRCQALLPLNPSGAPPVPPDLAFNTAMSFVTNTNWQAYAGETAMSHFSQMAALAVQNFLSAATGLAVLAALARGIARRAPGPLGNFWVDVTRIVLHVLLPLSIALALALVACGVVQSLSPAARVELIDPLAGPDGSAIAHQEIALGPAASQIAIKQLGSNGGGFFNANGAHPFENPGPISNALQTIAILLLPVAQIFAFGRMIGDARHARALLAAMALLLAPLLGVALLAEAQAPPVASIPGVEAARSPLQSGGNMEGKEVRFGPAASALWATATTAVSNGSVNAMHASLMPLGALVALALMQVGEVVFGGVGAGLYGMVLFAVVTVFVAGLMVGRTPEYLGKKIEAFEMKMASIAVLIPSLAVLLGTALALSVAAGREAILNPGPRGFGEVLYAFSSASNNNGSAFAGLAAGNIFYDVALGVAMFAGRYAVALPVLAMAGSLASKKKLAAGPGTLPTDTPLFVLLLAGVIVLVGALTFFPALALGPVVEQLGLRP